jgi:hypothetical protein
VLDFFIQAGLTYRMGFTAGSPTPTVPSSPLPTGKSRGSLRIGQEKFPES